MASNWLSPSDLLRRLDIAPSVEIEFGNEQQLQKYRRELYGLNQTGKGQFSTRRVTRAWSGPLLLIFRIR